MLYSDSQVGYSIIDPDFIERLEKNTSIAVYYDVQSSNGQYWIDTQLIWAKLSSSFKKIQQHV